MLRYDKRSRHSPAGVVTQKEEVVDGARAALALLRQTPQIDRRRIFLPGRQGGTLAPRIAAEETELAGVIILAGATRPLGQVLVDQLTYLSTLSTGNPSFATDIQAARRLAPRRTRPCGPSRSCLCPVADG